MVGRRSERQGRAAAAGGHGRAGRRVASPAQRAVGVYLHIPFCRAKCPYCAFVSVVAERGLIKHYLEALQMELEQAGRWLAQRGACVPTVYIGGGTPTSLEQGELCRLLGALGEELPLLADAEVTVEANPGTVDRRYLAALLEAGANRLSLGVQALDNELLRTLGRIHCAEEARQAVRDAQAAGFPRISVDLMYAIPGQTLEQWRAALEEVASWGMGHVSCYSLTYEEGTALAQAAAAGEVAPVDEELELEMFWLAEEVLGRAGLRRYEISNFAVPGEECRHNLIYWRGGEYLGLGAGAHSFVEGWRRANVSSPEEYIAAVRRGKAEAFCERPTEREQLEERVMLGLRLTEGVACAEVVRGLGRELREEFARRAEELERLGLVEIYAGRIKLTHRGLPVADSVVETFF